MSTERRVLRDLNVHHADGAVVARDGEVAALLVEGNVPDRRLRPGERRLVVAGGVREVVADVRFGARRKVLALWSREVWGEERCGVCGERWASERGGQRGGA